MPRTKPPFRADHVGSLLRPAALKAARGQRERGEITAAELAAVEDREIETVIRKQEDIGLRSKLRAFVAERGDDPQMLPHIYARMIMRRSPTSPRT